MQLTTTTRREYRFEHPEVLEALGVSVDETEEFSLSVGGLYVFVTVTAKETA